MGAMQGVMSRSVRPSPPALARLLPLADRVEALTRTSGRAFVARDARLAESVLAQGGEHERLDSALDAEWSELLGRGLPNDVPRPRGRWNASETVPAKSPTAFARPPWRGSGRPFRRSPSRRARAPFIGMEHASRIRAPNK